MALNEMKISDLGILSIARKISDTRKYDSGLINSIGNIKVSDNYASGFSTNSYLYKNGIALSGESITITCTLKFVSTKPNRDQLVFSLKNSSQNLELHLNNNQITFLINSKVSNQLSYLNINDDEEINIIISIKNETCNVTLYFQNRAVESNLPLNIPFDISGTYELFLGNEPENLNFLEGSLNLANFTIALDDNLIYSPSKSYPLTFSKILVSDGEFELQDNSFPIADHIYEFSISEITKSGNAILLTSQIDDDSKLIIREIGLYASTDSGEILFGKLGGLSINKGENVPYDLIFTLNTYISVVNVVGFPNSNSFLLNEIDPCTFENYIIIRNTLLYVYINLERIIAMNAMNIGYNRAQVFYQLVKEISEGEDAYFTIENFVKLSNKLKRIINEEFDPSSIVPYGNVSITNNGIASNFSGVNYVTTTGSLSNANSWEIDLKFLLNSPSEGTILSSRVMAEYQPFIAKTVIDSNKVYFYVSLKEDESTNYIINTNIFEIEVNKNYFVKIKYIRDSYNVSDSCYEILVSDDGENYHEEFTKYSDKITSDMVDFSIGAQSAYNLSTETFSASNPFSGIVYLMNLGINSAYGNWKPVKEEIVNNTQMVQFFHIPDYSKNRYVLYDLCNPKLYKVTVLDNKIQGNADVIDLFYKDGFSLCIEAVLKTIDSKVILAKADSNGSPYFLLAVLNRVIYFFIFTNEKTITLSKAINETNIGSHLEKYLLFNIITEGNKIAFYIDGEKVDEFEGIFGDPKDYRYNPLTNYVSTSVLKNLCEELEIDTGSISMDDYVAQIEANQGRYVKDIIGIQGALSNAEMRYVDMLINN